MLETTGWKDVESYKIILLINLVVNLMNDARRVYCNQFIEDNSTDQRRLFAASKSLLYMKKDRSLPPHSDVSLCANDMAQFFIAKITNIRWTRFLHHILYCQHPYPTWNLNLVILYFPTSNAKRLRQFVIWLHRERTNLASWTQCLLSYYLHV